MDSNATQTPQSHSSDRKRSPSQQSGSRYSNDNNNSSRGRNGPPNKRRRKEKPVASGSSEEVLLKDIEVLLDAYRERVDTEIPKDYPTPFTEIELDIDDISSTGDGLALSQNKDHVYVVPFSLPGDTIVAKIVKHFPTYTLTDFIRVVRRSTQRDDSQIFCQYFNICSGCQFQMLPYNSQLEHKRRVIQKAFKHFSGIDSSLLPEIGPTFASPLISGYRTKLTPHFDGPRKGGFKSDAPTPDIGFQAKGRRMVLDIEDCPIGTNAVRKGMKQSRDFVKENLQTYRSGATLLLRESTTRTPCADDQIMGEDEYLVENAKGRFVEKKSCVTNSNDMSTEYIDTFRFDSTAGSFFQNNNSILVGFTNFVRENLQLPVSNLDSESSQPKYLVDAYCGSGLFTITCGSAFTASIGVDISIPSIASARKNAKLNFPSSSSSSPSSSPSQTPSSDPSRTLSDVMTNIISTTEDNETTSSINTTFIAGQAEAIFAEIKFPPNQTSVVIDPPRKGCDELFLQQLVDLGPRRIVYISCNVHTQARDIGWILNSEKGRSYRIDSIRGFDFFPQTHHVEGCAVLTKVLD